MLLHHTQPALVSGVLRTCPSAILLNCFILASFSHVLKRSISRSIALRASSSDVLSLMSAPDILRAQHGTARQGTHGVVTGHADRSLHMALVTRVLLLLLLLVLVPLCKLGPRCCS